jgi:hypothetical protein
MGRSFAASLAQQATENSDVSAYINRVAPWLRSDDLGAFLRLATELRAGATVRFAHQANFLSSINVSMQAWIAQKAATHLGSGGVALRVVVDHDLNDDVRFRSVPFPVLSSPSGKIALSVPPIGRNPPRVMYSEPLPAGGWPTTALVHLQQATLADLALFKPYLSRFEIRDLKDRLDVVMRLMRQHLGPNNLVRYNVDVNDAVAEQMRFGALPARWSSQVFKAQAVELSRFWEERSAIQRASQRVAARFRSWAVPVNTGLRGTDGLFWWICSCGTRRSWDGNAANDCLLCGAQVASSSKVSVHEFVGLVQGGSVVPRVLVDNLLEGSDSSLLCGVGYAGAAEHHLFTAGVAAELKLGVLPEFLRQLNPGLGAGPALAGKSFAVTNRCKRDLPGRQGWTALIESGRGSIVHTYLWGSSERLRLLPGVVSCGRTWSDV